MSVCLTCRGYGYARGGSCWTCKGSGSEPEAALTPAPQAETHQALFNDHGECQCPHHTPQPLQQGGEVTRSKADVMGVLSGAWSDGLPLDQTADAILALFASPDLGDLEGLVADLEATESSHERRHREDNLVNPDGPDAARAIRSLAADRDKAVGLIKRLLDADADAAKNPMGGLSLGGLMDCRDNIGCVYQSADLADILAKLSAFLSSQTEES